ncbi:MAG TPA: pyridoxamine 5'-phosphate oxidase family protein [Candidatus Angelobacter sp.]|nr:pyridoxamine 5'-phosphate oxidase family protein [Candidatus Angelobacter sp.]
MTDPALTVEPVIADDLRDWLLSMPRYPVLAVLDSEGAPNQSVMWFDLDPDRPDVILMNTRVGRAKERFVRRDPRASLCFEEDYDWIALQGTIELDEDRDASMRDIRALAVRYGSNPDQFHGQERITMRLRVERVIRHD